MQFNDMPVSSTRPSKRKGQSSKTLNTIPANESRIVPCTTPPESNSSSNGLCRGDTPSRINDGISSFRLDDLCTAASLARENYRHDSQPNEEAFAQLGSELISSHQADAADSYLGDPGYGEIYGSEIRLNADDQRRQAGVPSPFVDLPPPELVQGFEETYFEYCSTWCPVLDKKTIHGDLNISPLVMNALSLAASHVQPPVIIHAEPASYYDRVKQLFYGDQEPNLLLCLKAIALVYWWSPRPPSRVHRDSSWWWTTVAIRHAQHGGFHREPKTGQLDRSHIDIGLRRRLWWTFFARERLTALCQCRPCVIDIEDCNVAEPTLQDFPVQDIRAEIFIQWVKLCGIVGNVAKHLMRTSNNMILHFPVRHAQELISWAHSLPHHLSLPIEADLTVSFNRDVHQLHLPYLATIIVLHLSQSTKPLPRAYPAAILAASCIARILKDFLARGRIRYLMGISCWYCGMAMLALLHAQRIPHLAKCAEEDIRVVLLALQQLRIMWPTADIFLQGFERLRSTAAESPSADEAFDLEDISLIHGIEWTKYFPFVTTRTSGLAQILLNNRQMELPLDQAGLELSTFEVNDLFRHFDGLLDMTSFGG
ncbi:transcription factor domain-containing protein [Aspergillus affinis]|uniref:transcription factor domain-containing protein n=1 Tax=Aspergillus affinis TaxID=1070780 RepID=UPI0022FEDBBF|nr:uncharacterized protein KD926_005985 [Aspergillus affinis]KAI9046038.1 hypothetical protein KD926_005985 [Aspergillus affinis]